MWDPKVFTRDKVFKDDNFLVVSGLLTERLVRLNIINVYAPQQNVDKRNLWLRIHQVMQLWQDWWIVFGDFNAVRSPEERKNSVFDPSCARDFNDFIDEAGLREYNLKGLKYTYLVNRGGECKLSRIDRMLFCSNVFNKWPNACVRALHRDHSDHSPLVLSVVDSNFRPKPFRWFDSWMDRPGCQDLVKLILEDNNAQGPADLALTMKLRRLRNRLKIWFKKHKQKEDEDEMRLRAEKEEIETMMEQKDLDDTELWVWAECKKNLEEIELHRSRDIKQKSRVNWASFGDENTAFFHNVVNGRKARNAIPGLEVNGEWVSKPTLVKKEVLRFFKNHFREHYVQRPIMDCSGMKTINNEDGSSMWKKVVVGCHGSSRAWTMLPCNPSASGCWKQIVKVGEKRLQNGRDLNSYFVGVWEGDKDGIFTVNKAKKVIADRQMPANVLKLKSVGWTPLKCNIMVWRADLNRLPTRVELVKRGIQLDNELCPLCDADQETSTHLFTGCLFTSVIWSRVGAWCRLSPVFAFDISDLLMLVDNQTKTKKEIQTLRGIIYTAMWSIWNERNDRVFNNKSLRAIEVVKNIKLSSFFWIRHRSRLKGIDWNRWCKYPLDLM
ncbi:RNA-directed DNA polymerase, eukaryota, Reverse transcriptase zinc-binding domain protein [Artemisia annua]|uniref:RNA-directed DNA polymerase, eukaryota, Reverse transcriptase zinc-binding domain protein n=1 Tax=Artemisia annua TaxID=35608 RepID=A0A2U1LP67_ARTAN|nr:RNA-directed DNA polymerase, eukaryota, Reverse transcriptase zinc-binding domain protein [Artemisia annua]